MSKEKGSTPAGGTDKNEDVENRSEATKEKAADAAENGTGKKDPAATEEIVVVEIKPEDYASWGLGRGVDITKKKPWVEKSSFQVRRVDVKSCHVIETKEGGILKAYNEEFDSQSTLSSEVQAGVKLANTPMSVRMDMEYTRSTLSAKYVSGKKIKTRTISFGVDFSDVPPSLAKTLDEAKADAAPKNQSLKDIGKSKSVPGRESAPEGKSLRSISFDYPFHEQPAARGEIDATDRGSEAQSTPAPADTTIAEELNRKPVSELSMPEGASFEERLCTWLLHCLMQSHKYDHSVGNLQELIHVAHGDGLFDEIQRFLDHFVQEFKITHYVSAIELGALEYQELTRKQFDQQLKVSSKASASAAVYGGGEVSTTQKIAMGFRNQKDERKKIGVMNEDKVKKEAVIGCSLKPVSGLIKMRYLQQALRKSIDKYVREASAGGGPYWIVFGDDLDAPKYITVDPENDSQLQLKGTEEMKEAEGFMVKVFDNSPSEFSITSSFPRYRKKKEEEKKKKQEEEEEKKQQEQSELEVSGASAATKRPQPLQYYLETTFNPVRRRSTVHMKKNSRVKNLRLLLKERIDPKMSCDTKQWRKGREAYYIKCIHRPRSGYLCVKEFEEGDKKRYEVCLKPTVDYHCDHANNVYMLFQLMKFSN